MTHDADDTLRFIERRKRLITWWPLTATGLIAMIIGLGVWSLYHAPYLADPRFVIQALSQNSIPQAQLETAALLVPLLFWLILILMLLLVGLGFACFATEKRYLRMLAHPPGKLTNLS